MTPPSELDPRMGAYTKQGVVKILQGWTPKRYRITYFNLWHMSTFIKSTDLSPRWKPSGAWGKVGFKLKTCQSCLPESALSAVFDVVEEVCIGNSLRSLRPQRQILTETMIKFKNQPWLGSLDRTLTFSRWEMEAHRNQKAWDGQTKAENSGVRTVFQSRRTRMSVTASREDSIVYW